MSDAEFNHLVELYLDRSASVEQVGRLREMLVASPELTRRFKQREKLHRTQLECLSRFQPKGGKWLSSWLMNFAQRFNRSASYVCLIMVVLVQTRVSLDTDYKGLNLYVIDSLLCQDAMVTYDGDESERWFESTAGDIEAPDMALSDVSDDDDDV